MSKRLRYLISSCVLAIGSVLLLNLPYESRYFGIMAGVVVLVFCFWFGLGLMFESGIYTRLMTVVLPVCFYLGWTLFDMLLPLNWLGILVVSGVLGGVMYTLFLVENVFVVAIGYKTVPLYRAAYTVGLIILLITAFLLFNSVFSFKWNYWLNSLIVFGLSVLIFLYQFWAVAIELPNDGNDKKLSLYVLVPSIVLTEMALVLSFWPVGIFKGSLYLVLAVYVLASLIQAKIRERLFRRIWLEFVWITVAVVAGIIIMTRWR